MGNSPADRYWQNSEQLKAEADADRAARLAGRKPLFERQLERLRPHRKGPGSDPQNFPRTPSDPAQNTSNATATTIVAGSLISAQGIG